MSIESIKALRDPGAPIPGDLTPKNASQKLAAFAKSEQAEALPVLRRLLGEPGYETAAAEALGRVPAPESAELLQTLEKHTSRAVRRAAKQSLFRLKSQGIAPPPKPITAESTGLQEGATATNVDGNALRSVAIFQKAPMGAVRGTRFVVSSLFGVERVDQRSLTGSVERAISDEVKSQGAPEKFTYVEIPVDYARWLVIEGKEISQRLGLPAPKSLAHASAVIGSSAPKYERALIYQHITTAEIRFDLTLTPESGKVLDEPEMDDWFGDADSLRDVARVAADLRNSALFDDQTAKQRLAYVYQEAHDIMFGEQGRKAYARMLEENAYVFWKTERIRSAKRAVAAAMSLLESGRASTPFSQAFTMKTLGQLTGELEISGEFAEARKLGLWVPS